MKKIEFDVKLFHLAPFQYFLFHAPTCIFSHRNRRCDGLGCSPQPQGKFNTILESDMSSSIPVPNIYVDFGFNSSIFYII